METKLWKAAPPPPPPWDREREGGRRENPANVVHCRLCNVTRVKTARDSQAEKAKQLFLPQRCNSRFKTHKPRRVRSRRVYESLSPRDPLFLSFSSPLPLLFLSSFLLRILLESLNASILKYPSGDKVAVVVVAAVNKVARLPRASLLS